MIKSHTKYYTIILNHRYIISTIS